MPPLGIPDYGSMQGLIDYSKSLDISHAKLHFKTLIQSEQNKLIINTMSIIDKYYDVIKANTVDYQMTDAELIKYKFQPKYLSFDLYGTTELWSLILKVNNMLSATQFTRRNIKILTNNIFSVLNEILILEDKEIKENNLLVYRK
jgi:hypothetical protein